MARASTYTWLPLDEWAKLLGISAWHFNGITFNEACGLDQVPCDGVWYQYPHHGPRLTREDLASAIKEAERIISTYVGYNLLPDYNRQEVTPVRHYSPEVRTSYNAYGAPKSVRLGKGYVWGGGIRKKTFIENLEATKVDKDGDGVLETVRLTFSTDYPINDLRFYYPGEGGLDSWEIRPVTFVTFQNPYIVEFPVYMIVNKIHMEGLCHTDVALEATDLSIYLESVDLYRVYTDKGTQARLIYAPSRRCTDDCGETYHEACLDVENHMLGYVNYNSKYREPDRIEVFYNSGWIADGEVQRPFVDLDPYWKSAVAYFAAGLLDQGVICCGGVQSDAVSRWREELDRREERKPQFMVTMRQVENPFGIPTRGAWYALQKADKRRL